MNVRFSTLEDFDAWIALAREVEPLFGPMADELSFQEALRQAISDRTAFCIRSENDETLNGGIVISKESNEIVWLAVSEKDRGNGFGRALLEFAIRKLDQQKPVSVQTFDESVIQGAAARKLYKNFGFDDFTKSCPNPAGIPTIIMQLTKPADSL